MADAPSYHRPLTEKLTEVEEALVRLETPQPGEEGDVIINPDLDKVLRGILNVLRELSLNKWAP